jgi:phage host-nuclease inhibitor protein Gam
MFIFMDTLTKLQTITYMYRYVKFRSTIAEAVRTRKELEKEQFLIEKYS